MIRNEADRKEGDEKNARERARLQSETEGGEPVAPMRADDHSRSAPAIETPIEARQGYLDRPVLMVLVAALALTIVAWFIAEIIAD